MLWKNKNTQVSLLHPLLWSFVVYVELLPSWHFLLDLSRARRAQTLVRVSPCVHVLPPNLHSRKLLNNCSCWVEFARGVATHLGFLDDTEAKKIVRVFFLLHVKNNTSVLFSSSTVAWKQTQSLIVLQICCHSHTHTPTHTHAHNPSHSHAQIKRLLLYMQTKSNETFKIKVQYPLEQGFLIILHSSYCLFFFLSCLNHSSLFQVIAGRPKARFG